MQSTQSSTNSAEVITQKSTAQDTTKPHSANPTLSQLNNLIEESLQIYELENQKTNSIDDLYNSFKTITEFLSFSVNIQPKIFNLPSDSTVTLLPNLDIFIKLSNGKTETKGINTFPAEVIALILESIMPDILGLIKSEKARLTETITFLRTATKQLKQLGHLKDGISEKPTIIT